MTECHLVLPGLQNVACLPPVEKVRAPWLASPSCLTAASLHSFSRVTSPMLLVALAVFFGACYILYLRTLQSKLVLFGEKPPAQMNPWSLESWSFGMQTSDPKSKFFKTQVRPSLGVH